MQKHRQPNAASLEYIPRDPRLHVPMLRFSES